MATLNKPASAAHSSEKPAPLSQTSPKSLRGDASTPATTTSSLEFSNSTGEGAQGLPPAARIRWFDTLCMADVAAVGGKNASLGELTQASKALGIRVPRGFAIPTAAFRWYLDQSGLTPLVETTLRGISRNLKADALQSLKTAGSLLREAVLSRPLPAALSADICEAYRIMQSGSTDGGGTTRSPLRVAVRSSATAEDLPDASFAGAQETFLNVTGEESLVKACHRCFASLYTDRAINYRFEHGFGDSAVALSVGVQEMVEVSDGASGVLFTLDTETGFRDIVLVNAVYGLGEPLVQGRVTPDEYVLFKPTLNTAPCAVLHRTAGGRELRSVPAAAGGVREEAVPAALRNRPVLDDATLLKLARWGCAIEAHYSRLRGMPTPMDIEWAWEGNGRDPAILQARPETVHARHNSLEEQRFVLDCTGRVLVQGVSIGTRIAGGRVRILESPSDMGSFRKGDILVAEHTDPDWEPVMKMASGIVTERGGRTCHAAIVSRELGVPAIVGARDATRRLADAQSVTISCADGECGTVYDGILKFHTETIPVFSGKELKTQLCLNVSNPATAFRLAPLPSDGVGLIREEFLLAGEIGIHPMALINHRKLPLALRNQIDLLTSGYADKEDFFITKLSEGIGQIAAAFYPRPALLRFSDLKSNEYAHLLGGEAYEPAEENPMLGFRGASRYCHPDFRAAFALECEAVRRVREGMGLRNLRVMIPFCRTPDEARRVLEEMAVNGLARGKNGLEVWMMCEIPSNVILALDFCELFDGFSIGSNDLTQLTLGVDRDSSRLAALFDERNPAIERIISQFLKAARNAGVPVGICGQAPSDYPDFARFLVREGITSISLEPDALLKVREVVAQAETEMGR